MYLIENIVQGGVAMIATLDEDSNIYAPCAVCGARIEVEIEEFAENISRDGLSGTRYTCEECRKNRE